MATDRIGSEHTRLFMSDPSAYEQPTWTEGLASLIGVINDAKEQERRDEATQSEIQHRKDTLEIAREKNRITKMQFEKQQRDESEAEDLRTAQSLSEWQDRAREFRKMGEKYNKDSYMRMADEIEKNGTEKDGMSKFKNNMYSEDNPYKIDEYLRREGENLQKHYKGAFEYLNKRSTDLKKQYSVSDSAIQNSPSYKAEVDQIHVDIGQPGMFGEKEDGTKYTIDDYNDRLAQARLKVAGDIQRPLTQAGIMPTDDADMDKIWENPEAREAYFANPLDSTEAIMEKFGMTSSLAKRRQEGEQEIEQEAKRLEKEKADKEKKLEKEQIVSFDDVSPGLKGTAVVVDALGGKQRKKITAGQASQLNRQGRLSSFEADKSPVNPYSKDISTGMKIYDQSGNEVGIEEIIYITDRPTNERNEVFFTNLSDEMKGKVSGDIASRGRVPMFRIDGKIYGPKEVRKKKYERKF